MEHSLDISSLLPVLAAFGLTPAKPPVPFGSGHINHTFLVHSFEGEKYILQKINTQVFQKPEAIANNLSLAAKHLETHAPGYLFLTPVHTLTGDEMFVEAGEYWRLTVFVPNSMSINEATSPEQAYEAARQFGLLARHLNGLSMNGFKATIPDFHNLTWRYQQFQQALDSSSESRKKEAAECIQYFLRSKLIVDTYQVLLRNPDFPDRLMHHDTKINNVLLNTTSQKGLCVCDLDTLMPGKIISDVGDMIRTFVSPVSEESTDFEKISVRLEYYEALMNGYLSEMKYVLTPTEKDVLFFSGPFLVYMQGLRFLADFLNGDVYYPIRYPEHNLRRAQNQMVLLQKLFANEDQLNVIIQDALA
ncbi:phosphotransferase enzyme family protein [Arundinibacter roseus]|uniref:Aminoglycoside phosphotransferase family protein n=1 Tax=Arundinibacter roseus TaxID=2070510 RepID=A0A4R4KI84_9BACT|nr:aminoglycoside phosphotransferase family protein [Arundinibacter roseus]TDB67847.1 aminoglycoside phosphotransferase family protein [Arundinibacter roseus]